MGHVELDKSWQAEERASEGSGRTTSTRPTLDFVCSNTNNVQELIAMEWDVFICHASEDKDSFVRPLAMGLQEAQLKVWYDEFTLNAGDSLRRSIDKGLAGSRWGLVVLSPYFFAKEWPQRN